MGKYARIGTNKRTHSSGVRMIIENFFCVETLFPLMARLLLLLQLLLFCQNPRGGFSEDARQLFGGTVDLFHRLFTSRIDEGHFYVLRLEN